MGKLACLDRKRFMDLCRKELVEHWRTYILRLLLMYGVMSVLLLWNGYFVYESYAYALPHDADVCRFGLLAMVWFLFIFGAFSASYMMEGMKSKTGRIAVLMTPATNFEKYFSRWLIAVVVFLVVFLLAFRLADYTRVLVYTLAYPEINMIAPVDLGCLVGANSAHFTLTHSVGGFVCLFLSYLFFQSCFVLGSVVWSKNALVKTFVTGGLIILIYFLIFWGMTELFFSGIDHVTYKKDLAQDTVFMILSSVFGVGTLLNWVLGYYRFKESEVIHRL